MLKRLTIRGVRSFSPRESNTLEFYSPLTLIVGANGTGKTTIIESLKYVTTGNLPPNSKGGAFIYDPQIARECEVKAQVKILFSNVSGVDMICSRSIQVSRKKDKIEQKTLESVLCQEGGEGVSGKCGDVDMAMQNEFGVSTSVLENIIFCHQEESTWPLSEPVVVKKKLDEIFASVKYGKALDSLKSSKRECCSDIKMKQQEFEFLKKMKDRKENVEMRIKESGRMIEKNEIRLEAYDVEIKRSEEVIEEICIEMKKNDDAERRIRMLRSERNEMEGVVDGFKGKVLMLDEVSYVLNDEVLDGLEKEYGDVKKETDEVEIRFEGLNEERMRYLKHKSELDGIFAEISMKCSRLKDAEERRSEILRTLEEELKVKNDFRETARHLFEKVERDIKDRKDMVYELEKELMRMKDEDSNKEIVRNENMRIINEYEGLKDDMSVDVSDSYEDEIERLRNDVECDRELEILDERLNEYQRRLNVAFSIAEGNFMMNQLRNRRREIERLGSVINDDETRIRLENERNDKRSKIRMIEQEINTKRMMRVARMMRIDKIMNELKNKIDEVIGMVNERDNDVGSRNIMISEIVELIQSYEPVGEIDVEGMELDLLDEVEEMKRIENHIGLMDELSCIDERLKDEEVGECVPELRSMIDGVMKIRDDKRNEMKEKNERISTLCRKQEMIRTVKDIREKICIREVAKEAMRMNNGLGRRIEEVENEIEKRRSKIEKIHESFSRKRVELEMNIENDGAQEREILNLKGEIESLNCNVKVLLKIECSDGVKDDEGFNSLRNDLLEKKNRMIELGQKIHSMYETRSIAEENMKYHMSLRRMGEIDDELKDIDVGYLDSLGEKRRLLEEKRTKLISQRSLLLGECKQIALGIKSFRCELQKDHGNTLDNYNRCYIEIKALELACLDLDKCIQVLDRAIVDFHSSKLEEVNITLKDLWTNTYKGHDIDWIEIVSESVGQKTYNYKVVFVKDGVSLDMRGRSSAGQRMIASILIRLALADSFSTSCNILTLDEPTTNLDRDNIESLAFTLSRIISRNRGDKSFQLVVITHDEEFVQLLSRDGPEYFYRLSRNDNGDSVIMRHSINSR